MSTPAKRPIDVVTLEMAGALEHWGALVDGTIHLLLRIPVRCPECGREHAWFVNRNGRTKCTECDAAAEQAKRNEAMQACAEAS